MNSSLVATIFFLACATAATASLSPSTTLIQGPSSKATVLGPDGSAISSVSPGGRIIAEDQPGYVAYGGPSGIGATGWAPTIYGVPPVYETPSNYGGHVYGPPSKYAGSYGGGHDGGVGVVIKGPSGVISTKGAASYGASFTYGGYGGEGVVVKGPSGIISTKGAGGSGNW